MIQVTEKVQLIQATPDNANEIYQAIDENRESLRTWLPFVDSSKSATVTRTFLENTKVIGELAYMIRHENVFAGLIGLREIDKANHKAEIGYWLVPSFEGKGFVTQSCLKLIEYAFEELDLNRILIRVAVGNKRSRMVPARLGFLEEGIERDGELLASGYTDLVRYSLLKREFDEGL